MTVRSQSQTALALEYLVASGSVAICMIEGVSGWSVGQGHRLTGRSRIILYWLPKHLSKPFLKKVRANIDINATKVMVDQELLRASAMLGIVLTPHAEAIARAENAARRLTEYFENMNASGSLAAFNREFRLKRMAATARGEGFMSYRAASRRLKMLLIARLVQRQGDALAPPGKFFEQVFGG